MYIHIYMDVCIYKNNIDKISVFLLKVWSLELYLNSSKKLVKEKWSWMMYQSLWNWSTDLFFFLLNRLWLPLPILYMSKKASNINISEQIQRPSQRLKLNFLKTLSFWCTTNHSNWHFSKWTSFYTRKPWITLLHF